jgi:hypothetical protein
MITRGTFLTIGGRRLLWSTLPANIVWRTAAGAFTVEAEPSYKTAGGIDTIGIGGLTAGNSYGIAVDGKSIIRSIADTAGSISFALDLKQRILISIMQAGSVKRIGGSGTALDLGLRSLPECIEVTIVNDLILPAVLTAYGPNGRLVKRWVLSGRTHYFLPTKELAPGIYLFRIENKTRSGPLRVFRLAWQVED